MPFPEECEDQNQFLERHPQDSEGSSDHLEDVKNDEPSDYGSEQSSFEIDDHDH